MTTNQYRTAVAQTTNYTDRSAYVSDLALSDIWGDAAESPIPAQRLDDLAQIWDACQRSIKEIAADAGMSCRKLADRCCIPYRTVEDWSAAKRECSLYIRLMIQQCLGLLSIEII